MMRTCMEEGEGGEVHGGGEGGREGRCMEEGEGGEVHGGG